MAYFTQEQCAYLESIGFYRLRSDAYILKFDDCHGTITVEEWRDGFNVMVETTCGIDACVFNADNLKKAVRSALRRYKYKAKNIQKMIGHIDEIYEKTEEIPK